LLHVAAWLCAFVLDLVRMAQVPYKEAPGAFTLWLWGFITLTIGLVVLLAATVAHALAPRELKFAEGGAPPFMMTLFIGGAQISLILTILQMLACQGTHDTNNAYYWINHSTAVTDQERTDQETSIRNVLVLSMVAKVYIVQFLKNNQEWAGPANALQQSAQDNA
jgi:hypothetical protein